MLRYSKIYLLLLCLFLGPFVLRAQLPVLNKKTNTTTTIPLLPDTVAKENTVDTSATNKKKKSTIADFTADTLFLINGDKITGKIISFEQGRLKMDADGPGDISVKWHKILTIAGGNRIYKIEDLEGGIYYGHIDFSVDTGKIMISNMLQFDIDLASIAKIFPLEEEWYRGFKGSFGGGLSHTKASDVLTANADYNLYYVLSKWTFFNDFSFVSTSTNNETASLRIQTNLQALYSLPKKWVLSEVNAYNKNDELGINSRYTIGVQAGNNIVQTDWQKLSIFTGLNANSEKVTEEDNGALNLEWPLSVQHTIYKFIRPNLSTSTTLTYYGGITETGRQRWDISTNIQWEFINNFNLQLAFYYDYDNKVIEDKPSNTNYGTTISLILDLK